MSQHCTLAGSSLEAPPRFACCPPCFAAQAPARLLPASLPDSLLTWPAWPLHCLPACLHFPTKDMQACWLSWHSPVSISSQIQPTVAFSRYSCNKRSGLGKSGVLKSSPAGVSRRARLPTCLPQAALALSPMLPHQQLWPAISSNE